MTTATTLGSIEVNPTETAGGAAGGEKKPETGAVKTPEQLAADKATADAAEAAGKPFLEATQLKLPEGAKLDEALAKDFLAVAKEHGFTAKQAQAVFDLNQKATAAQAKALEATRDAQTKAAGEALKADKDIGGANWEKSKALVGKVFAQLPVFKEFNGLRLDDGTMLGDRVEFAKALVELGKKLSEDSTAGTHTGSGAKKNVGNDPTTLHKGMYSHPTSVKSLKY